MLYICISCSCITTSTQDKQHKKFPTYIKRSEATDKASLYIIIHICLPQCQGYCVVKLTTGHKSHCGHLTEYGLYHAAWKNHRTLVKAHSKTDRTKSTKVFRYATLCLCIFLGLLVNAKAIRINKISAPTNPLICIRLTCWTQECTFLEKNLVWAISTWHIHLLVFNFYQTNLSL